MLPAGVSVEDGARYIEAGIATINVFKPESVRVSWRIYPADAVRTLKKSRSEGVHNNGG